MQIVDSDAFLDMPLSAQCLYFHLNMRADDDGFVDNPKKIMRMIRAGDDDMRILITKRFVLTFDSGVIVIKHWRMHNTLTRDRYHETAYLDEKALLKVKDNKSYSFTEGTEIDDESKLISAQRQTKKNDEIDGQMSLPLCEPESEPDQEQETDKTLDEFYESIWKLYPVKKGKGQVSYAKKKKLQGIGYDQIARCIKRFVAEKEDENTPKQYWMHGSTFFNSGYVDYLDENYQIEDKNLQKPEKKEEPGINLWDE